MHHVRGAGAAGAGRSRGFAGACEPLGSTKAPGRGQKPLEPSTFYDAARQWWRDEMPDELRTRCAPDHDLVFVLLKPRGRGTLETCACGKVERHRG